jgi:hypothetical protein
MLKESLLMSSLAPLYQVASDGEAGVLDNLTQRLGFMVHASTDYTSLFAHASDGESALLDDLARRAGLIWICFCHWHNPSRAEICESCGRLKADAEDAETDAYAERIGA